MVTAVLESLSAPMGAEDTRTREQRYHDGLQEAMRRLVASGLLPERAGQPVKAMVHVSLAELRAMDDSALEDQWITEVRARWAAPPRRRLRGRQRRRRLAGRGRRPGRHLRCGPDPGGHRRGGPQCPG